MSKFAMLVFISTTIHQTWCMTRGNVVIVNVNKVLKTRINLMLLFPPPWCHVGLISLCEAWWRLDNHPPAFFSSMFVLNDTVHSYQTRHRGDIHIPLTNTTSAQNSIRQYVPRLITPMPFLAISKVNTHSYIGFSNYV